MNLRLERRGLVDGAYEALKGKILDQLVAPGEWMNIDLLAPQLGVSQTPIREALSRLEADGLVVKRPQGGYFAAPLLDESAFEHLYEVRLLLEPRGASLAAHAADRRHLETIERAVRTMRTASRGEAYHEYREFSVHDALLHDTIAGASGNPVLRDAIARLRSHHQLSRFYTHHGVDAEEAMAEHEAILAAIHRRDAHGAAKAMRTHLEGSRRRLREFVRAPGRSPVPESSGRADGAREEA